MSVNTRTLQKNLKQIKGRNASKNHLVGPRPVDHQRDCLMEELPYNNRLWEAKHLNKPSSKQKKRSARPPRERPSCKSEYLQNTNKDD